jgi:flagellum-specific peptidoglycan hydrolase FlgJ
MQQPSIGYGGGSTDTISNLAQQAATQLGWNPTFVLKQWALETGNFTSRLYKNDNNIAGIKWYPGMTYGTKGSAAPDGGNYAHFSDPVTGYVNFVKNNPRYSNVKNSQDVYTEAKTIAADGWATDPNYASKIMGIKVDGSQAVDTSGSGSSSNSDSGSSAPSFGIHTGPGLLLAGHPSAR